MTAVTTPTHRATPALRPDPMLDERRVAGVGAIGFAAIVLATNIALGATPAADAPAAEVVRYLEENRTVNVLGTTAFALGALFLVGFAAAFYGRLRSAGAAADRVWARMGAIGAFLIIPTFAAVVTNRIVLLVGTDELIGSPELVTLVWRLEMAAFAVNSLPMAAALLGFGLAGARSGLLPGWFARLAPVAAGAAVLSAATAVGNLEGQATGLAGFVGFGSWMLLLVVAGLRQLRSAS